MEQEKNKQEQTAAKQGSSPVDISQLSEEQKASLLAQLNADKKMIEGELAPFYVLTKVR